MALYQAASAGRLFPAEADQEEQGGAVAMLLRGLAGAGNALDLPGSMVRDLVAGQGWDSFDQLATPFSGENRTSGRDLMRQYGLVGDEDNWGNFAGGLGAEILLDPLGGPLNKLLKGAGKAAAKGGKSAVSGLQQGLARPPAGSAALKKMARQRKGFINTGEPPGRLGGAEPAPWRNSGRIDGPEIAQTRSEIGGLQDEMLETFEPSPEAFTDLAEQYSRVDPTLSEMYRAASRWLERNPGRGGALDDFYPEVAIQNLSDETREMIAANLGQRATQRGRVFEDRLFESLAEVPAARYTDHIAGTPETLGYLARELNPRRMRARKPATVAQDAAIEQARFDSWLEDIRLGGDPNAVSNHFGGGTLDDATGGLTRGLGLTDEEIEGIRDLLKRNDPDAIDRIDDLARSDDAVRDVGDGLDDLELDDLELDDLNGPEDFELGNIDEGLGDLESMEPGFNALSADAMELVRQDFSRVAQDYIGSNNMPHIPHAARRFLQENPQLEEAMIPLLRTEQYKARKLAELNERLRLFEPPNRGNPRDPTTFPEN